MRNFSWLYRCETFRWLNSGAIVSFYLANTNLPLFCFRREPGLFRRQQEEEGRSTGPEGNDHVTYDKSAHRASQGNGIALATGSGTVIPKSPANLLESGNARGCGWSTAEPRRLLLATEHRDPRGRPQGKGSPDIGGALEDGGEDTFHVSLAVSALIRFFRILCINTQHQIVSSSYIKLNERMVNVKISYF